MIYLYAQPLEDHGAPEVVINGEVVDPSQETARIYRDKLLVACEHGSTFYVGDLTIHLRETFVALQIPTGQLDVHGRRAPVMAAAWLQDLSGDMLTTTAQSFVFGASLIGRTVDEFTLLDALARWMELPSVRTSRGIARLAGWGTLGVQRVTTLVDRVAPVDMRKESEHRV